MTVKTNEAKIAELEAEVGSLKRKNTEKIEAEKLAERQARCDHRASITLNVYTDGDICSVKCTQCGKVHGNYVGRFKWGTFGQRLHRRMKALLVKK